MQAEPNLIAAVVNVMGDSVTSHEHFGLAEPSGAVGLTLTVASLVNDEAAAHRGEHRPAFGVRVLSVLRADRPEQHAGVELRGVRDATGI